MHARPHNSPFSVRRLDAQEWREYRAFRLRALADSPNAFGSTLEREQAEPDDHWERRLRSGATSQWDLPVVAAADRQYAGLVWGRIDPASPDVAYVNQMWVAPEHRGQSCGALLLDVVVQWARAAKARTAALRVTCGDNAARRLYVRAGFKPAGDPEPLRPGSEILAQPMRLAL